MFTAITIYGMNLSNDLVSQPRVTEAHTYTRLHISRLYIDTHILQVSRTVKLITTNREGQEIYNKLSIHVYKVSTSKTLHALVQTIV